ncbi:hypothetical protein [Duganella vulcania]|uniref:MmcB family DNA repair protein n=1 Tax=Duganella vulcania TaxID=2692166 RepID=A0A845GGM9_9BURK|nr:hypothetical protein [Duganella vulcania]MYM92406.1 hypothetical protein [Duganella vulcania]
MPSELHNELSTIGAAWLKRNGFAVVATELTALGCRERADVIGFRSQCSATIESKVSRADFLADWEKPHREVGGIGLYRFYICPAGQIGADELPARWGLLYVDGKRVTEVARPRGNIWPGPKGNIAGWAEWQHEVDQDAEPSVLFSISRRLSLGQPITK